MHRCQQAPAAVLLQVRPHDRHPEPRHGLRATSCGRVRPSKFGTFLICSVTGREKPEVWISDPKESVVVQISADLRTIRSTQFKTGYSLRFPKVHSVRCTWTRQI